MGASGHDTMWAHVAALGDQLAESSRVSTTAILAGRVRLVRVCGMGGSAAAADLVGSLLEGGRIRIEVRRDYGLGGDPGPEALLVFSSYSGGTEETLAAWDEASRVAPDRPRVVVTSGGELQERADRAGVPRLTIPGGLPPRASLGHGIGVLCALLAAVGEPSLLGQVDAAVEALQAGNRRWGLDGPVAADRALEDLAARLDGRWPLLYSGCRLTHAVARRWRAQINENAKLLVSTAELPELDHNEVVGWGQATPARTQARVLALRDESETDGVRRRFVATREVLDLDDDQWSERSTPAGLPPLARMMSLVQEGDVLSCLLARRAGIDPVPVTVIDRIKTRLSGG